ncbi:hypothetical protein K239x_47150 [Planctomycetes bacterium K23_9]|uniref:Uncharacterized protein n=1 Tax=Stieleria marina TaxID=1930275 RepID=A0A517P010_9BACT|nr:hypothetical protein K239x_47150 [Planctomycetes bacterium K23_9]
MACRFGATFAFEMHDSCQRRLESLIRLRSGFGRKGIMPIRTVWTQLRALLHRTVECVRTRDQLAQDVSKGDEPYGLS